MYTTWGWLLIVFTGVLCWAAQVLNALAPTQAERLGLSEPEADVDSTYYADGHGEALWDAWSLWVLPLAGALLILDIDAWAIVGLIGGGMYVYFAGRGLASRRAMHQAGVVIGKPETVKVYNVVLVLWGLIGLVTIALAAMDLASR